MENLTPEKYIKRFSKKWWENIWYYYKWFIIGIAFAVAIIIFGIVECATNDMPDFTLSYMGGIRTMDATHGYAIEDELAKITPDIDNDGKHKVKVNVIYLDDEAQSEEMGSMYSMAEIEFAGGNSVAMLFTEKYLDHYAKYGFCDLEQYVKKFNIDEQKVKRDKNGIAYAIDMKDNKIFTSIEGMYTDDLYLAIRPMRENEKSQWQKDNYANGVAMAQYIISDGEVRP